MAKNHKADIAKLDKGITSLRNAMKSLDDDGWEELLKIIHRPGWTTPAEITFSMGIVESLSAQVKQLADLKNALVKGSGQVGSL